jgi:hypothetical protein
MRDKIDREIDEILKRFDESGPREDEPEPGLSRDSRLPHVSLRRILLVSCVLVLLAAAGLFFGLVYPSLDGSGSAAEESSGEGVGADIGEGAHVDEAWPESSSHTGESEHGVDRPAEDHEEHDRDGGEQH